MSFQRKNARRLRNLRRGGVAIDGDYRVTGEMIQRLGIADLSLAEIDERLRPRMADPQALLFRLHPRLQRVILQGLGMADEQRRAA